MLTPPSLFHSENIGFHTLKSFSYLLHKTRGNNSGWQDIWMRSKLIHIRNQIQTQFELTLKSNFIPTLDVKKGGAETLFCMEKPHAKTILA